MEKKEANANVSTNAYLNVFSPVASHRMLEATPPMEVIMGN